MELAFALIDEASCIGCTLCVRVCPTDAIVGARGRMHTVIAERCTGCRLCLPPCPVDCIAMRAAGREWSVADDARARARQDARIARLARTTLAPQGAPVPPSATPDERRAALAAALARARERRRAKTTGTR
ncbi:MAG: RnfABCDGE type electron transport complex subunit B [Betaproteobacteria bacterium]